MRLGWGRGVEQTCKLMRCSSIKRFDSVACDQFTPREIHRSKVRMARDSRVGVEERCVLSTLCTRQAGMPWMGADGL
jgi:hypothetical protein